jgi:hypothetical protein
LPQSPRKHLRQPTARRSPDIGRERPHRLTEPIGTSCATDPCCSGHRPLLAAPAWLVCGAPCRFHWLSGLRGLVR